VTQSRLLLPSWLPQRVFHEFLDLLLFVPFVNFCSTFDCSAANRGRVVQVESWNKRKRSLTKIRVGFQVGQSALAKVRSSGLLSRPIASRDGFARNAGRKCQSLIERFEDSPFRSNCVVEAISDPSWDLAKVGEIRSGADLTRQFAR
jgi:hypothetical protein